VGRGVAGKGVWGGGGAGGEVVGMVGLVVARGRGRRGGRVLEGGVGVRWGGWRGGGRGGGYMG